MFCSQCGSKIESYNKFCPRCGKQLNPAAPAPAQAAPGPSDSGHFQQPNQQQQYQQQYQQPNQQPVYPAAAPSAEPVVWVFQTTRKLSMFKAVTCYVVFMRDHAVLAHISAERLKFENEKAAADVKAQGLGFFKGSAAMMHNWADFYKRYYSMGTNAILAEDPMNMVIHYAMLSEVYYRCFSQDSNFEDSSTSTTDGKLQFSLSGYDPIRLEHTQTDSRSVKETLTSLFGYKLKYKR